MLDKRQARLRRAKKTRYHIRSLAVHRLVVNRSPRHIYAQVISPDGSEVLIQASTLDTTLRSGSTGNIEAASKVGALVAQRAVEAGIKKVAFDRSGYQYHGRVKALAEAARNNGLEF